MQNKKGKDSFSISKEGVDYYYLIIRHIDRMSEGLRIGLDVGQVNTKILVGYYEQILHLEAILIPFLDEEYYEVKKHFENEIPAYSATWSGDIGRQIEYFKATQKIFKLLIVKAYNARILKLAVRTDYKIDEDLF